MKLLLTVVMGLLVALGSALTANDDEDRSGGVCVGSMEIEACVPPDARR